MLYSVLFLGAFKCPGKIASLIDLVRHINAAIFLVVRFAMKRQDCVGGYCKVRIRAILFINSSVTNMCCFSDENNNRTHVINLQTSKHICIENRCL